MQDLLLEDRLCFTLYALSRQLTQLYWPHLEPLGLTYPQYLVLLALREQPGLSVKAVGAKVSLDSGTLTPLLKRLATRQLLTRQRSPADDRALELHLTPAGAELLEAASGIPVALSPHFALTQPEFETLLGQLQPLLLRLRAANQS